MCLYMLYTVHRICAGQKLQGPQSRFFCLEQGMFADPFHPELNSDQNHGHTHTSNPGSVDELVFMCAWLEFLSKVTVPTARTMDIPVSMDSNRVSLILMDTICDVGGILHYFSYCTILEHVLVCTGANVSSDTIWKHEILVNLFISSTYGRMKVCQPVKQGSASRRFCLITIVLHQLHKIVKGPATTHI